MIRYLLILAGFMGIAILAACAVNAGIRSDTKKMSGSAASIATFAVPEGYSPEFSAALAGYTLAAYTHSDGHSHLYLIQSEKQANGEILFQMLAKMAPGSSDSTLRLTVIDKRSETIRGQETQVVVSEGTNSSGSTYRQLVAAFQGKGGPAMLVLLEPSERWNQESISAFLRSIQ